MRKGALEKFKDYRKNRIKYDLNFSASEARTDLITGETVLNPNSYTFDPERKPLYITGYASSNRVNKSEFDGFNKVYTKSGANSRRDYAAAAIIHEFLHSIGVFDADVTVNAITGEVISSNSIKNQYKVISKCLAKKK